jgi:EF hand
MAVKSWILVFSAVLSLGLAGAAPAIAQQGAQQGVQLTPAQIIAFLDKDRDGKCSLQEYLGFQATRIAQFDANADGILQFAEFRESLQGDAKKNARRSFDAFNTEGDGRGLIQREFLGYHAYVFKTFVDANHDGFMSASEWSAMMGLLKAQQG